MLICIGDRIRDSLITVCVPLNVRIVSPPPPAFSMKKVGKPPRFHKRAIYGEMGAVVKA